ncbi:MAG: DNA translocase FtsK [Eubacteriales bacterium]|nr:DNA translocase FtsK [Eubacteriales bacterium]
MDMHVEMGLDSKNVIDSGSLDPLFEEAARIIVTLRSGFASLIQRRLSIGYDRAVRIMDQLEKAGIVGEAQGSKPREVKIQDESSLENLLVALRRTTEIINNMTNEEAYKDIVNLLKQKGDKRYIAVSDWEDECEGDDGDGTEVSIFGIGLDDDDEICVAAMVDNIGYGHGPDDFPREWTKATELCEPDYCAFHRFVVDNIGKAMTKEETYEVAEYYW